MRKQAIPTFKNLNIGASMSTTTNKEAILTAALDAAYPIPDTPHTSVKERAAADRKAFKRGYLAAPTVAATPSVQACDWPEDFAHENGNYMNACHQCKKAFMGYKRRVTCKTCAEAVPSVQGESIDSERAEFEKWALERHFWPAELATPMSTGAQTAWDAWQVSARLARTAAPSEHADDLAVDRFAAAMKTKLAKQRAKGYGGWEDVAQCTDESLADQLMRHAHKGDPVDVGNFAMMLHQRHGGDNYIVGNVLTSAALGFARRIASMFIPKAAPSEGLAIPAQEYQVFFNGDWKPASEQAYYSTPEKNRRIAPATEQAKPELAKLRILAQAAGGARFEVEGFEQIAGNGQFYGGLIMHEDGETIIAQCVMKPWADYIAAANPAAMLRLLDALAAQPVPQASGERDAAQEDIAEGVEILDSLIASIAKHGNYSQEATLTFLGHARQCFAPSSAATTSKPEGASHAD